ncbi:MAG: endonuclease III domain-containing protein [Phycisphaerae bacterium]
MRRHINIAMQYYRQLNSHFGDLHWWPAKSPVEVVIGAVLIQNTNWSNVEKAIGNLDAFRCLNAEAILALPGHKLEQLIRPSGYFRLKAVRLRRVMEWYSRHEKVSPPPFRHVSDQTLREELLDINGVGPETADSLLLYALNRPVFVVDTYTRRIARRHKLLDDAQCRDYHELQKYFVEHVPREVAIYNQYHALIVATGKHFCGPKPKCAQCPLRRYLPSGTSYRGLSKYAGEYP